MSLLLICRCFVKSPDSFSALLEIIMTLLELKRSPWSYWNSKDQSKYSVLSLCTAVSLIDSVSRDVSNWLFRFFWTLFPEMFPTGYFVSPGDNCDLTGRSNGFLCSFGRHHSLACRPCLQRCFQLIISSLLGNVSRDFSNWLFRLFWR